MSTGKTVEFLKKKIYNATSYIVNDDPSKNGDAFPVADIPAGTTTLSIIYNIENMH